MKIKDTSDRKDLLFFNKKVDREFGKELHRNTENVVSLTSIKNKMEEESYFDDSFVDLDCCWKSAVKVPQK